jgi:hypothetical protein
MSETTVVNFRHEKCDIKITRKPDNSIPDPPKSGCFGNPFPVKTHGREKCIELYRSYFLERVEKDPAFREAVLTLRGKKLGCFCVPLPYHGNIIKEWLDQQDKACEATEPTRFVMGSALLPEDFDVVSLVGVVKILEK